MARKLLSSYAVFENVGGTRDIVFYYSSGGADSVTQVPAAEADYIVDLLRNEKPMSYDAVLRRLSTYEPEPVGEEETAPNLDAWLGAHPAVAAAIVWQDAGGAHPWSAWNAGQKAELRQAFELARNRGSIAVAEVPPNQAVLADTDSVVQILAASDAWAYFKASVAQSLAIEIGQQVPWSLGGYGPAQLAELFDSRELFTWNASPAGYRIDLMNGAVVPAPPAFSYAFLGNNNLIGFSRRDTIANVLGWCRAHLVHFLGGWDTANVVDQWQYRGLPPLVRVINGTVQTSHPTWGSARRTGGCWGTTGFLRAVLRAVNIPVKLVTNAGHAQPWFLADAAYLSHGDDPYNRLTTAVPAIPPAEIITDETTFNSWFGAGVPDATKANNVGRRTLELALTYLPNYLLHAYCADRAAGVGHGGGQVFDIFSRVYTVAQLEGHDLWTRMDAKIASLGGCGAVPP